MKIRDPKSIERLVRWVSPLISRWMRTMSFAAWSGDQYLMNDRPYLIGDSRFIYAFWHEYILLPAFYCAHPETSVLVGQHADGELITQIIQQFGFSAIRGSSTRGGTVALLKMLRDGHSRHFAITPDGPRGPRRVCQAGSVYLASRSGIPIVPVGLGGPTLFRAKSWDRFAIPKPFSRWRMVMMPPIAVPPKLGLEELEPYRLKVEATMNLACDIAEQWALTGQLELPHELAGEHTIFRPAKTYRYPYWEMTQKTTK
ncbi:MAG: lysophospholipid acyltransferase family protein [Zavarzinella sp.]